MVDKFIVKPEIVIDWSYFGERVWSYFGERLSTRATADVCVWIQVARAVQA